VRKFIILFILLMGISHQAARAQDYKTVLDVPSGQTLVSISASERSTVVQDLLQITLRTDSRNRDAAVLQNEINTRMQKALELSKTYPDVKTSIQGYSVYPIDENPARPGDPATRIWSGQQSISLEGSATQSVLKLAGELQSLGLVMSNLSFGVSPDLWEETQNALLEKVLIKLKTKADRAAKALGKSSAELLQIQIDGGNFYAPVMMRSMAADSRMEGVMAPPVAAAGESEVTLSVSAQALLKQ
jgi:predicted secreted protein